MSLDQATGIVLEAYTAVMQLMFRPVFVGEWSLCMDTWSGDAGRREWQEMTDAQRQDKRKEFGSAQAHLFKRGDNAGSYYWTAKTHSNYTNPTWETVPAIEGGYLDGFTED